MNALTPTETVVLPHPLVDASGPGWAASFSHAELTVLSSGREAFFVDAANYGTRTIIVTPAGGRITVALQQLISLVGGVWLTFDPPDLGAKLPEISGSGFSCGQLRHAVSGAPVASLEDALVPAPGAVSILRSPRASTVPWLQFTIAVHHPARAEISLGGAAEHLVEAITGSAPTAWGTIEPATVGWDRSRLTALARARMPRDSRVYLAGGDSARSGGRRFSGSIRATRTAIGLTEETRLVFALPENSELAITGAVSEVLADLAGYQQLLFGTAWVMRGAADASILPYWPTNPQPSAAVIGARAIRSLGLNNHTFAARHDARLVGNPRIPSLVVDFSDERTRFDRFARAFDDIGSAEIAAALTPPGVSRAP